MIPLLRAGSFLANAALFVVVPRLLGAPWPWAAAVAVALFGACWFACGRVPRSEAAEPEVHEAASGAARAMGAEQPRFVRALPGWTAAAVRAGAGYGLLVGVEVRPEHREAVLAHEIAHHATGDLFWEPFTDGPARLLHAAVRNVSPLGVIALPFLLLGAPLARATELRADRLAADAVSSYPAVLREVASKMEARASLLYPSLRSRVRHAARDSNREGKGAEAQSAQESTSKPQRR